MRKFITIALTLLLVLSFAAIAFAIHVPDVPSEEQTVISAGAKITLGGRILVRGWYFANVDNLNSDIAGGLPVDSNSIAEYTTNAYLVVNAKLSDNLTAYMELESTPPSNNNSGLFHWGSLDTKPNADLRFRELWIQYTGSGLLGVPSGIKVGHMLLTLGEKQFLNHERFGDDAILVFVNPINELHLAALTAKLFEGTTPFKRDTISGIGTGMGSNADDVDYYGILGMYKLDKDNTIGLNYSYINGPATDLKLSNLGAHANGLLMGALTYAAELDWQFGSVGDAIGKSDFKGWGILAKVGYKLDPANLRASFAMGSGDDGSNDIKEFQTTVASPDEGPQARFVHYTQIYERTVVTSTGDISTGIADTTYFNLGLDFMPMKALNMSLDGFYLQATETDSWGPNVDDQLGWEIDFKGSYKITKNLTYFVEAGYFDAGDFYKDAGLVSDPKAVTQIIHGLNLTF